MSLFRKSEINRKIESGHQWPDKAAFFQDYYKSMEGKRDRWGWIIGIGFPLFFASSASGMYSYLQRQSISETVLAANVNWGFVSFGLISVVCIPFFMGQRWARKAMYFVPVGIAIAFHVIFDGVMNEDMKARFFGLFMGNAFWGLIVYAVITSLSIPNKAFFRIPYDQAKTERYWGARSNKYARYAAFIGLFFPAFDTPLMYGLASLEIVEEGSAAAIALSWFFTISFVGLVAWLGLKAFRIYAPSVIPPILGKGYAIFGMVAAGIWLVFFLAMAIIVFDI